MSGLILGGGVEVSLYDWPWLGILSSSISGFCPGKEAVLGLGATWCEFPADDNGEKNVKHGGKKIVFFPHCCSFRPPQCLFVTRRSSWGYCCTVTAAVQLLWPQPDQETGRGQAPQEVYGLIPTDTTPVKDTQTWDRTTLIHIIHKWKSNVRNFFFFLFWHLHVPREHRGHAIFYFLFSTSRKHFTSMHAWRLPWSVKGNIWLTFIVAYLNKTVILPNSNFPSVTVEIITSAGVLI